jgi:hypothetical protein
MVCSVKRVASGLLIATIGFCYLKFTNVRIEGKEVLCEAMGAAALTMTLPSFLRTQQVANGRAVIVVEAHA